mmetsp:Transcript_19498/g.58486  ORF Transcript_19498/g.58486 Transcript_19498/m.58486 type:complete len:200 (-) Transcript_19498:80-679(-)
MGDRGRGRQRAQAVQGRVGDHQGRYHLVGLYWLRVVRRGRRGGAPKRRVGEADRHPRPHPQPELAPGVPGDSKRHEHNGARLPLARGHRVGASQQDMGHATSLRLEHLEVQAGHGAQRHLEPPHRRRRGLRRHPRQEARQPRRRLRLHLGEAATWQPHPLHGLARVRDRRRAPHAGCHHRPRGELLHRPALHRGGCPEV